MKRLNFTWLALCVSCLSLATAQAQTPAQPNAAGTASLSCQSITIPLKGLPPQNPITLTFAEEDFLSLCTSPQGSVLHVTKPQQTMVVMPAPKSQQIIAYEVVDNQGHSVSAQITITRD